MRGLSELARLWLRYSNVPLLLVRTCIPAASSVWQGARDSPCAKFLGAASQYSAIECAHAPGGGMSPFRGACSVQTSKDAAELLRWEASAVGQIWQRHQITRSAPPDRGLPPQSPRFAQTHPSSRCHGRRAHLALLAARRPPPAAVPARSHGLQ